MTRTPSPWKAVHTSGNTWTIRTANDDSTPIAELWYVPRDWQEANAAFIVRACNAHSDLVAALKSAAHALRSYEYGNSATDLAASVADTCDAAISKAEA